MKNTLWFKKQVEHKEYFLYEVFPEPCVVSGIFLNQQDEAFEQIERLLGHGCYRGKICAYPLDNGIIVADIRNMDNVTNKDNCRVRFYFMGVDDSSVGVIRARIENNFSRTDTGFGPAVPGRAFLFYGQFARDVRKNIQNKKIKRSLDNLGLSEIFTTCKGSIYVAKNESGVVVALSDGGWMYFYILHTMLNASDENALSYMKRVEVTMEKERTGYMPIRWAGACRG